MEPGRTLTKPPEAPTLWSALASNVAEIEAKLARLDQGIALVGLIVAIYAALFLSRPLGLTLAGLALAALIWFTLAWRLLRDGKGVSVLRWALPLSEIGIPSGALWLTLVAQGPAYALGSWVPPQFFSLYIALQVLRMRPALPMVISAVAAASYGAFAVYAIAQGVPDDLLFRPVTQATRVFALLFTGGACTLAVFGLRTAITRAGATVRAHDLFGKYRIGRTIAQGGMGSVVEALYCPEGGFERRVAIKLIHAHLAHDPAFLERFRHEAALGARLSHPNIVSVLDFGAVDGQYFFAMEYVDGPTLRELLDQCQKSDHALPPHLVLYVARQMGEGLHFAHALAVGDRGEPLRVVHRDLSPSNVLLARGGQVKISDFGVARALGDSHSLHTTTLAGKPSYLAPEQLKHGVVDERTDLFALAVIVWEMAANRRLFHRKNEMATIYAVLEDPVPPMSEVRPELAPPWQAFFDRALNRDPAERFVSAAEWLMALDLLEDHEGRARPEDLAGLVRAFVDAPELEPDPPTAERE